MSEIKICPDCETEYFSHIENCADCGTPLLLPEESRTFRAERERCAEKVLDDQVAVKEGDKKWIGELYDLLIHEGIPCAVTADAGCTKGCSADTRRLYVSRGDAEKAHNLIEKYYREVHPELQASHELMSQGKCPACSSPVGSDAGECPDCGLKLVIFE